MTCRQCKNLCDCEDDAFRHELSFDPDCSAKYCTGFEPITNGDRIRDMSNKEIACFLAGKFTNRTTQMMMECGKMRSATEISAEADLWFRSWMQWLRMPAEVDMENKRQMMANLEDIVDLDAQTKANNKAMRKVLDFIVGERKDSENNR